MTAPSISRRNLLRGRLQADVPDPVRPPWSTRETLLESCARCGKCAKACPQGIIEIGADRLPELSFARGECTFCRDCADICPAPVFAPATEPPWSLALKLGEGCLAAAQIFCRSCGDSCPQGAIRFRPMLGGRAELSIDRELCTECGACISVCPASALSLSRQAPQYEATP